MALPVELFLAPAADAHATAVFEAAFAHTHRSAAFVTHDHQVGQVDGGFFLDDTVWALRAARLGVALDHVQSFHRRAVVFRNDVNDLAGFATIAAGDHHHRIVFPDARLHQITSGARERIFINFLARSSRATGPKIRVPIGSRWLSISTAEFESNLMYDPSARPTSLV